MYQFVSKPGWTLVAARRGDAPHEAYVALTSPSASQEIFSKAIARVEYRSGTLLSRIEEALNGSNGQVPVFRPPNDLPALLRTADQLLTFARQEAGARASVWRCTCGTRYAVPFSLMRPVSIRCERCGHTLDLDPTAAAESRIADPITAEVNEYRKSVSALFREAMARGWPVLVSHVES